MRWLLVVAPAALAAAAGAQEEGAEVLRRAEALLREGRPAAAAELVSGSGIAETDPQARYLLGFSLLQLYRFPEAEEVLERAVSARPDKDPWLHALAKARIEQGKNLAATRALERAIDLADRPEYRYARAMCSLNLGDLEKARADLEITLAARPEHVDALYQLGKLDVDRGAYGPGRERLRQALAVNPRHLEARYLTGLAELRAGRPEVAVTELEAVVAVVPNHAGGLYNLGRALIALGREEEGRRRLEEFRAGSELRDRLEFLRRAVKRNPENVEGRLALGGSYLELGMAAEALQELTAARALAPRNPAAYFGIAEALRRLGRAEEARQAEAYGRRLGAGG